MNEDEIKKKTSSLGEYINSLSPYDFTLIGTFIGFLFSFGLDPGQQNSLGNWFELIGQVLLTISAQSSATPSNEEYNNLLKDVILLKKEIKNLKKDN